LSNYSLSPIVANGSFYLASVRAYLPIFRTSRHSVTRGVPRTPLTAATASLLLYNCQNVGLPVTSAIPNSTCPHAPPCTTNPRSGSPPTSAPSRFPSTSVLSQALPRLPPTSPYLRAILFFTFETRLSLALPRLGLQLPQTYTQPTLRHGFLRYRHPEPQATSSTIYIFTTLRGCPKPTPFYVSIFYL